ncbi:MAG: tetratricopeptide repeat protein [Longimicrobiales bacterium]
MRLPASVVTFPPDCWPMGFWKKIFNGEPEPSHQVDFYSEGVELLNAGKYHDALTSFRLALRETPHDPAVLQQMAITYTRIGMTDEAIKTYRTVLARHARAAGAHYGLAFLMLQNGRKDVAIEHLRVFLASPPQGPDAQRHIEHARHTLAALGQPPHGVD